VAATFDLAAACLSGLDAAGVEAESVRQAEGGTLVALAALLGLLGLGVGGRLSLDERAGLVERELKESLRERKAEVLLACVGLTTGVLRSTSASRAFLLFVFRRVYKRESKLDELLTDEDRGGGGGLGRGSLGAPSVRYDERLVMHCVDALR